MATKFRVAQVKATASTLTRFQVAQIKTTALNTPKYRVAQVKGSVIPSLSRFQVAQVKATAFPAIVKFQVAGIRANTLTGITRIRVGGIIGSTAIPTKFRIGTITAATNVAVVTPYDNLRFVDSDGTVYKGLFVLWDGTQWIYPGPGFG